MYQLKKYIWSALILSSVMTISLISILHTDDEYVQSWNRKSSANQFKHSLLQSPLVSDLQKIRKRRAANHSLPIDFLKGKLVKEHYEFGFKTPNAELCPNNGNDMRLIVFVTTAPDHTHQRNTIRMSWGSFASRKDMALAFFIGRNNRTDVQLIIDREKELYGDVIEANFIDNYYNLTLKTLSIFEWLQTYCTGVRFILKTDDDMFINIPLLLQFISTRKSSKEAIYGRIARHWSPIRKKKSKYYIDPKIYNQSKYPDFVTGPAYLFTNDVVGPLFLQTLNTPYFVLEDVLIMGFVAESLGMKRIRVPHMKNDRMKVTNGCKLKKTISFHMVKHDEQFEAQKKIMSENIKC